MNKFVVDLGHTLRYKYGCEGNNVKKYNTHPDDPVETGSQLTRTIGHAESTDPALRYLRVPTHNNNI